MQLVLLMLVASAAAQDVCESYGSCAACTNVTTCGWCNGTAYDAQGAVRGKCVTIDGPSTHTWTCEGDLKNYGQCDCHGAPVPDFLARTWRGFYMDAAHKGEFVWKFENDGIQGRLSTLATATGTALSGNVSFLQDCPILGIQVSFDSGDKMACAYYYNWQGNDDAWTLSLGCNPHTAAMPKDFDMGDENLELFTCSDTFHCDFKLQQALAAPAKPDPVSERGPRDDACSSISSCDKCSAASGCSWCLGHLSIDGVTMHGEGHCFDAAPTHKYECLGLTLQSDCTVHKCQWSDYYQPTPDCDALEDSCDAPTTADDPDFYTGKVRAAPYLTSAECHQNCIDPTMGCGTVNGSAACVRTNTCDPTSNCAQCDTLQEVMQGIMISNNSTKGLFTFHFERSADGATYTAVNVTDPAGAVTAYTVSDFDLSKEVATFTTGGVAHGVRFSGFGHAGAFAKNVYVAIGKDAAVPAFGKDVMYTPGAAEYALLSCQVDGDGRTVSGQNRPLTCKVGELI